MYEKVSIILAELVAHWLQRQFLLDATAFVIPMMKERRLFFDTPNSCVVSMFLVKTAVC